MRRGVIFTWIGWIDFDPLNLERELVFLPVEVDQLFLYIRSILDLRTLLYILLRWARYQALFAFDLIGD